MTWERAVSLALAAGVGGVPAGVAGFPTSSSLLQCERKRKLMLNFKTSFEHEYVFH